MEYAITALIFVFCLVVMVVKSLKRDLTAEKSRQKEVSIGGVKAPQKGLKVLSPKEAERLLEYLEPQVRSLREIVERRQTPTPGVYKKALIFSLSVEVDGQPQVFQTWESGEGWRADASCWICQAIMVRVRSASREDLLASLDADPHVAKRGEKYFTHCTQGCSEEEVVVRWGDIPIL